MQTCLQEDEEIIGKTENMDQPQWEQSFDLEIDNEKQVSVFYNNAQVLKSKGLVFAQF